MGMLDPTAADSLRRRHADLEGKIRTEYARAKPDDLMLKTLKLEKLYVKEQMDRLTYPG